MSFHSWRGISEGLSDDRPWPASGATLSSVRDVPPAAPRWRNRAASNSAANATAHKDVCSARPIGAYVRKSVLLMRLVHARGGSPLIGLSRDQLAFRFAATARTL